MALELHQRGKSVVIISKEGKSWSSSVAAGVYNPFNFRRMTPTWKAKEACRLAEAFYTSGEKITGGKFHSRKNILRVFSSAEENELFQKYCAQADSYFADKNPVSEEFTDRVNAPFGIGTITGGGVVDTASLMFSVKEYFSSRNEYRDEWFEPAKLEINNDNVVYDRRITANNIIFCEGHLASTNDLFPDMPLAPTKGEIIHVSVPGLDLHDVLNGSVYVAPLGNDLYVCGATFNPGKSDENTTSEGREELLNKLSAMIKLPFRAESQFAGVRPAGRDRKPVIGLHPEHKHIGIMNGTGGKGVLMSPLLAQLLADHMESGAALPAEVDILRFFRKKSNGRNRSPRE